MKIAIDLGHGVGQDRGADGFVTEENIINSVGSLVIAKLKALGHSVLEVRPSQANNVGDSLIKRVDLANNNNVDLYVSTHANAGGGRGTEVFTYRGQELEQAREVLNNLVELGFINRGIKSSNLFVINQTNATAMLIEICFTDTQSDVDLYNSLGVERIANAIVKGLVGETISTPVINPPAGVVATIVSGTKGIVTADTLNVRATPGGTIIGQITKGTEVKIDRGDGDWYSIFYGDHGGYISKQYVSIGGIAAAVKVASLDGTYATVLASTLNVRDSIMGNIIGQLKQGDQVKLCRQENGWYHIYYGDSGAWVCADYLKI